MYTIVQSRKIEDHDLLRVRVDLINGEDDGITVYKELEFSHGYVHELESDVMQCVKDNLENIEDFYASVRIQLNTSEIDAMKQLLGHQDLSNDSWLLVSVLDIRRFDFKWNLSEHEKVNVSTLLKSRGNYKAKQGKWSDAFKNYHNASKYLKGSFCILESTHALHRVACELLIDCMNNVAIACLKLESGFKLCVKYCDYVLELDVNNSKALYRKAKALLHLKEFEKALQCVEKCLVHETDEKIRTEISLLHSKCVKCCKEQTKKDSDLCRDIFQKLEVIARQNTDEDSAIPYDIKDWENSMADQMLSINEELEAFGEQMPPRVSIGSGRNGERYQKISESDEIE